MNFLYYYIRSMRLYLCFITGSATFCGVGLALTNPEYAWSWKTAVILLIGFLSWGVNQIINDYFDRKEDSINAPHRPMVTSLLPARKAFYLSSFIMLILGLTACWITPWTLLPVGVGFILNIFYGFTKGIPLLGNAFYAFSISMCTLFGYLGTSGGVRDFREFSMILICCTVLSLSHFLMCLYSTLKDVTGDRAAGKRTLAVLIGVYRTKFVCGVLSLAILIFYFKLTDFLGGCTGKFMLAWSWCYILAVGNIFAFSSDKMHRATKSNCQLCIAQQLLPLAIVYFWCPVVMPLFWLAVEITFRWYPDEKE